MIVYRIAKRARARDFSGRGAMTIGRRWNSAERPMLYASTSRSLAVLEILAHAPTLPVDMVVIVLELPSGAKVTKAKLASLPDGWNSVPPTNISQEFGDEFLRQGKALALRVPSAIVAGEDNVLINTLHPLANKIKIVRIEELAVDSRLK